MRIISWNVNGFRSVMRKGFADTVETLNANLIGLQEVRAKHEQIEPLLPQLPSWSSHFSPAERPGYSGVGVLSKETLADVRTSLQQEELDVEGRFIRAKLGDLVLVNAYFPKGSGRNRDNARVPYKLNFYRTLWQSLEAEKNAGVPMLVMGDFNTAHHEIDLARPRQNMKTSGFLPEEREEVSRWVTSGWTDTFRMFEPSGGHYSWWYQAMNARERNVGWRIDYVFASPAAKPLVREAFILPNVLGSDHCPVGVTIDL